MKSKSEYRSEALGVAYETASNLYAVGLMDGEVLREFGEMCLTPESSIKPEVAHEILPPTLVMLRVSGGVITRTNDYRFSLMASIADRNACFRALATRLATSSGVRFLPSLFVHWLMVA